MDICKVRKSAEFVSKLCTNVSLNYENLEKFANNLSKYSYPSYSESHNIKIDSISSNELILLILSIDSVNFCFWPYNDLKQENDFEYHDMVSGFVKQLNSDFFTSKFLQNLNEDDLSKLNIFPKNFPLLNERARSLNELGYFLETILNNNPQELLQLSDNCCIKIAEMLVKNISTYRDESIYKGNQVFLYKRAQIAAADMYIALKEKNINLKNFESLTMFPDYRVPQILNEMGIMIYSDSLNKKIADKIELMSGCEEEIEIRMMTIYCVEQIKKITKLNLTSVEIDYILWNEGEKLRKSIVNHHRTLTIFY